MGNKINELGTEKLYDLSIMKRWVRTGTLKKEELANLIYVNPLIIDEFLDGKLLVPEIRLKKLYLKYNVKNYEELKDKIESVEKVINEVKSKKVKKETNLSITYDISQYQRYLLTLPGSTLNNIAAILDCNIEYFKNVYINKGRRVDKKGFQRILHELGLNSESELKEKTDSLISTKIQAKNIQEKIENEEITKKPKFLTMRDFKFLIDPLSIEKQKDLCKKLGYSFEYLDKLFIKRTPLSDERVQILFDFFHLKDIDNFYEVKDSKKQNRLYIDEFKILIYILSSKDFTELLKKLNYTNKELDSAIKRNILLNQEHQQILFEYFDFKDAEDFYKNKNKVIEYLLKRGESPKIQTDFYEFRDLIFSLSIEEQEEKSKKLGVDLGKIKDYISNVKVVPGKEEEILFELINNLEDFYNKELMIVEENEESNTDPILNKYESKTKDENILNYSDFKELILALSIEEQENLARKLGLELSSLKSNYIFNKSKITEERTKILFEYFGFKDQDDFYKRKLVVVDEIKKRPRVKVQKDYNIKRKVEMYLEDFKELISILSVKEKEELAKKLGWSPETLKVSLSKKFKIITVNQQKILLEYFGFKDKIDFYKRKEIVIKKLKGIPLKEFKELILNLSIQEQEDLASKLEFTHKTLIRYIFKEEKYLTIEKQKILLKYFGFKDEEDFYNQKYPVDQVISSSEKYIEQDPLLDNIDKDILFSNIKSLVTDKEFKIAYLLFGGYEGRYYSPTVVADFLGEDILYVIDTEKKVYKIYSDSLIESSISDSSKLTYQNSDKE